MAGKASAQVIAMRGAGYYSSNTVGAKAVIDRAGDLVVEAVGSMALEAAETAFSVCDYGAADGGTSLDMMRRLVDTVRQRAPGRAIQITYTDLPHNDFSALFRLTQGLLGDQAKPPIADTPNLFILGSSVFPTSATANPTLTIAALTLRAVDAVKAAVAG